MATTDQMTAAVHGYVEAFEQGDAEMAVALFAPDATVEDPVGTPLKRGHDEIRAFYAASMATGAKLRLEGPIRCAKDHAAFAFRVQLTLEGKMVTVDVIDIFRFNDDGKVIEMRAFFGPENMTGM
jgi:steroid Delta-isomerase